MTVGEMREIMRRRVVPEDLVPQNVIALLMDDEDVSPPELDAFTFLTRLRALGIGSADFVYLMEGCGAPQQVVDKIRNNPAMNLQGLILTLENSELTADDYKRILYTARQIWERTLTLRLEKSEMVLEGDEPQSDYYEPTLEEVMGEVGQIRGDSDDTGGAEQPRTAFVTAEPAPPIEAASETEPFGDKTEDNSAETAPEEESAFPAEESTDDVEESADVVEESTEAVEENTEIVVENTEIVEDNTEIVEENEEVVEDNAETAEESAVPFEEGFEKVPEEEPIPAEEPVDEQPEINNDDDNDIQAVDEYLEFAEYNDLPEPEAAEEPEPVKQPYNGDTTAIIKIDAEMLKLNLAKLAEEELAEKQAQREARANEQAKKEAMYSAERARRKALAEEARLAEEQARREAELAEEQARQEARLAEEQVQKEARAEAARIAAEQAQQEARAAYEAAKEDEIREEVKNEAEDTETEQPEEDEIPKVKKEPFVVRIPHEYPYHKGAIITAAAGAAVVIGASVGVTLIPEPPVIKSITYAADNAEIFTEIYYSHNDNIKGGEKACSPVYDYNKIFGDLLVTSDGFGTFSEGDNVYTVTSEAVSVSVFNNAALTPSADILPPEGTNIINVFEENGALVTVFSGADECGFMRISGGQTLFTVRQDGLMTDFDCKDGDILIGSVYTPKFTHTFGVQDSMIYMPCLGVGEKNALAPQSVIPSGTKGYSYGISAAYSSANGATRSAVAVLGNPISASTDGRFILSGEEDMLMTVGAEEITAVKAEGIQLAAFGDDGSATYEGGNVNLRGRDGNITATIANPAQEIKSMWFEGDMLRLSGVNGVFITMDCSDLAAPKVAELKTANGTVTGDNAVIYGSGANSLTISHYKLENGAASLVNTYTKALSPELLGSLEFGGTNTVIVDGVRFGAGYRYFDGVSIISEYAVMEDSGQVYPVKQLYDDRTGFTLAFKHGGNIYAQCGGGILDILN